MTRSFPHSPRGCLAFLLVLLLVGVWPARAVEPPPGEGEPFMQYFSPRDYHSGTQCWCFAQDRRGVMYVGNQGCVLEYDGSTWRKIPVGEGNVIAGLAYEPASDTIFVGVQNDLGYLKPAPGGERVFVSLLDRLPADARDVGGVFGVYVMPEGVFFVGNNLVLRWRDGRFHTWRLATANRVRSHWAGGCLYVSDSELGLLKLEADQFVPVSNDPVFRRASVRTILAEADGTLLVGTFHDGMFALRGGTASPVTGECAGFLKEKGIYRMLRLRDGSLAVATDTAGLLVLDGGNRFRNRVDEAGGLHGNNILNLYEDAEGGVWIGLQSGMTRAEVTSPLSILRAGRDDDLADTYLGNYWFGKFIVGNSTGLYRVVPAQPDTATGAHLERLPGITESFRSTCAVDKGVLTLGGSKIALLGADGRLTPVAPGITDANFFCRSRLTPGVIFVSRESGRVTELRLDAGTGEWVEGATVADTGKTGEFGIEESPRGDLWLGTREHGLFRARRTSPDRPAEVVSFFDRPGPLQGVPFVIVSSDGGPIIILTLSKLCRVDDSGETVRVATDLGESFGNGSIRFETVMSYEPQHVWITAHKTNDPAEAQVCGRATTGGNGRAPTFKAFPHKVQEVLGAVRGYLPMDAPPAPLTSVLMVGATGNGIVRVDVRRWDAQPPPPPYATLIRRAATISRARDNAASTPLSGRPLPHARNSVHFEFAAATVAFGAAPRFQTRLVNFGTDDWSDFSERNSTDYLNLPEGDYVFEVRARNSDDQMGSVASLPFRVLPPWQRTPWAYAAYLLTLAAALAAIIRWRGRQLRRRNAALETLVDARTMELRGRETELVRARDDAEKANRAKSAFLANMSHELRTPLNAVLGYAQLLLKQTDLTPRSRERVTVIGQSGGHLLSLVNEVLDLSKVEAGKLTLSPFDFSLHQLLDEVGAAFRPRLAEKKLTFTVIRASGLPPTVHTDQSRLRQVLFNLLSNAAKFTHQGGVTLTVRPADERSVCFEVADTGVGIEPKDQRDIFMAFYQTGESNLASQGTGLGLTISQRLVELLGGRIEVESTPGEGSRFWFELPLFTGELEARSSSRVYQDPDLSHVTGYEGARRRLLLVDDLSENRRVLRGFLQPLGFEIEEAADGTECLTACARLLPDAVLLDLRLGTPDGFEVARSLRARTSGGRPGIIAISASVFESDRQQAIDAGCDDFLPKPFAEAQLLGTLGRVLGLQWVQATPAAPGPPVAETPDGGEPTLPADEIEMLRELSLRGDVAGIRRCLDARRTAGAPGRAGDIVRRLESLAAAYDMEGIHDLLLTIHPHDEN